jgi:hypothetical protein
MVVISVKQSDGDGFLYETTIDTLNDDLIKSLVDIHNERLRAKVIVDGVRGLAIYGPMKEQNQIGIDEVRMSRVEVHYPFVLSESFHFH